MQWLANNSIKLLHYPMHILQSKDLKEHNEYKFRIRAFNSVGTGEPGVGASMIAKNPYGKQLRQFYCGMDLFSHESSMELFQVKNPVKSRTNSLN